MENWRETLLLSDATLQEAIQCLNNTGLKIVLVVSSDDILLGTITDGDIRRAMLQGLDLDRPVASIAKSEPLVVSADISRETALELMAVNSFTSIPVVDKKNRVVGLHYISELVVPVRRSNQMVIMAGGRGSRLSPFTENCPKPLLPVDGKPMLEHIILRAKADGFHKFVLAVHYLGQMIEEYFGDGTRWEVKIEYLREESPLGTAGALGLLNPSPEHPILVTNGDVLTDISYGELLDFHCKHSGAMATMAVRLYEWQHPFGVVSVNGVDIIEFEEKPISRSHINAGVYVLQPQALEALTGREHCDMPTLFKRLKEQSLRTIVYPIHEPWMDVGRVEDYSKANGKR